jgi:hypothetical protein
MFLSLMIGIFILSCLSFNNLGIYPKNSTVPKDQLCTLTIKKGVMVLVFDGRFVRWNDLVDLQYSTKVLIEPGKHHLIINVLDAKQKIVNRKSEGQTETFTYARTVRMLDKGFEIDFISGHHYEISSVSHFYNISNDEYDISGLNIRNVTTKESIFLAH